jgi:hypothetical protein
LESQYQYRVHIGSIFETPPIPHRGDELIVSLLLLEGEKKARSEKARRISIAPFVMAITTRCGANEQPGCNSNASIATKRC